MHLYISPVRSDESTRKTCAASERGRIMAPFSRATGRWCPLLRLQAEFPKEAFHEPERLQLPAQGRMRGAVSPRWPMSCQAGSLQNCHHIQDGSRDVSSVPPFPASCPMGWGWGVWVLPLAQGPPHPCGVQGGDTLHPGPQGSESLPRPPTGAVGCEEALAGEQDRAHRMGRWWCPSSCGTGREDSLGARQSGERMVPRKLR